MFLRLGGYLKRTALLHKAFLRKFVAPRVSFVTEQDYGIASYVVCRRDGPSLEEWKSCSQANHDFAKRIAATKNFTVADVERKSSVSGPVLTKVNVFRVGVFPECHPIEVFDVRYTAQNLTKRHIDSEKLV